LLVGEAHPTLDLESSGRPTEQAGWLFNSRLVVASWSRRETATIMEAAKTSDIFTIERHGDLRLFIAHQALEAIDASLEPHVAGVLLTPLKDSTSPLVLFDLGSVDYFGSMFLSLLLRCWKLTNSLGGMMALCGVSSHAKELLRLTSLDIIFPIYATRQEAMEALLSD
jgi:anti-sigma B factor antagonist